MKLRLGYCVCQLHATLKWWYTRTKIDTSLPCTFWLGRHEASPEEARASSGVSLSTSKECGRGFHMRSGTREALASISAFLYDCLSCRLSLIRTGDRAAGRCSQPV